MVVVHFNASDGHCVFFNDPINERDAAALEHKVERQRARFHMEISSALLPGILPLQIQQITIFPFSSFARFVHAAHRVTDLHNVSKLQMVAQRFPKIPRQMNRVCVFGGGSVFFNLYDGVGHSEKLETHSIVSPLQITFPCSGQEIAHRLRVHNRMRHGDQVRSNVNHVNSSVP